MSDIQLTLGLVHHSILKFIIEHGFAPDAGELGEILQVSEAEISSALVALEEYHGVVLHPKTTKIWVIHPFSLAPTNFVVRCNGLSWWGNCAWCSLGIAALLKEDLTITTTLGADGEQVHIQIRDGKIVDNNYYIHFPIPMIKAWDNVIYTCSTMLLFEQEHDIDSWCQNHRIKKGDVQPLQNVWEFAQVWYGNHLNPEWQKWTNRQAQDIFDRFALNHPIWKLPESDTRF